MTYREWLRAQTVIQILADRQGRTPNEIRASMQDAIDEAWRTTDPAALQEQWRRFPDGKPTPEEFIVTMSDICYLN